MESNAIVNRQKRRERQQARAERRERAQMGGRLGGRSHSQAAAAGFSRSDERRLRADKLSAASASASAGGSKSQRRPRREGESENEYSASEATGTEESAVSFALCLHSQSICLLFRRLRLTTRMQRVAAMRSQLLLAVKSMPAIVSARSLLSMWLLDC